MDVSIVIVSFNTKELLLDCLKSIENASKRLKTEVFVVDNNSHDQTTQAVKDQFPQIKVIANQKNIGFSKANNLAIKLATGKYILVLNPDTKLAPDTLLKMKDFMDNNSNVAVATCRVELTTGNLDKDCRRHFPTPWRSLCHFTSLDQIFRTSKLFDQYYMGYISDQNEHEIDSCAGAFMIIRSPALKKVGTFDEDFFFYGEDLDLCWRFKEKGYKIMFTPITKIIHYKGASSGIKSQSEHLSKATRESKKRALVESIRAMKLFYQKHYREKYPFFVTWLVLIGIKLLESIRLLKS